MDHPVQPTPRRGAFSVAINRSFFLWGGSGASVNLSHIQVFNSSSCAWTAKQTTGTPPFGCYDGASTNVGDIVYTYGGLSKCNQETRDLHGLDTTSLAWQLLSQEGPMKKAGCAMAAIRNMLVFFGGRTCSPGCIQPGSRCIEIDKGFYTNEFHAYNLKTSKYMFLSTACLEGN